MIKLLKNRNFSLLYAGNLVSRIGSTFYNFAVGWFILTLTSSPLAMGVYIALGAIVELIASPLAGVFIDRLNKVRILYITDYIRGFTVLFGGFLIFTLNQDTHLLFLLYAITVILAINNALFFPANSTLVPEIVEDQELNQANAFFSLINSFQAIIGILLAGIFYSTLGIQMIFIINGISFILSALSEMFIKTRSEAPVRSKDATVKTDFIEGLSYIKNKPGLLPFIAAVILLNFAFAPIFANVIPYLYNLQLNKAPIHLATAQITFSSGMLLGGIAVGAMGQRIVVAKSLKYGFFVTYIAFFFVAILMHLVSVETLSYSLFTLLFLPGMFFLAVSNMFINIPFNTGLVRAIDQNIRGRVFSIIGTLTAALVPISFLFAGLMLEYTSLSLMVLIACVIASGPLLVLMFGKRVKLLLNAL